MPRKPPSYSLRKVPEPQEVRGAPLHDGCDQAEGATPAIRAARRGRLVPGAIRRQHLADSIRTSRDARDDVVVPLYVEGYAAGYRRRDHRAARVPDLDAPAREIRDRKSTRLNSSHGYISYAVFCLKKKKEKNPQQDSHPTKRY